MIMHVTGITMHITHYLLHEDVPQTPEEKIAYAKDALAEVNNQLKRKYGISLTAFIEPADISIT